MCRVEFPSNAHIISVAVHPGHRRIGLATALMVAAHTAMIKMGLQRSHLEVRVSNAPAIALYEKLGYRKARVISSYYADGTDGILMELSLRPAGPNGAP